jgi:2-keto-3-deoxy-L-rhamnonate aldolase RhmA
MSVTLSLKERLRRDGKVFGPMIFEFFSPGMPAIVAGSGADFILFDMEHTGLGYETLKHMIAGCRGLDVAPLVRVPTGEYHFIARALDLGAHGIMVPMVESRAQAEHIAACAHYPPFGRRGAAFGVAHDGYRAQPISTMEIARERTLVIAQIETAKGLENVEDIAATDGVDVIWLGHFDLTNFLGIPGQFQNPIYLDAIKRIVDAAQASKKIAGFLVPDDSWATEYWKHGFRMLGVGPDHVLFQNALAQRLAFLKSQS